METEGLPAPRWAVSLAVTVIVLDLFQALLLEAGSSFNHPWKELRGVDLINDHRPQKKIEKIDCSVRLGKICLSVVLMQEVLRNNLKFRKAHS